MLKKVSRGDERMRRHVHVRTKISGTPECPRLNVFCSNSNIHAQIIDDVNGITLASASSAELKLENGGNAGAARTIRTEVAKRATEKSITGVIFDHDGYVYTGRVEALAETARAADLKPWEVMQTERRPRRDHDAEKEFEEHVVAIDRVTEIIRGGRRFRFVALVVIGDKKGRIGLGTGKANEVPDAIKKTIKDAKKNIFAVPAVGTTIPHVITRRYRAGEILLRPAPKGTGVTAGGPARAILELTGINDIFPKCLGGRTPINMVRATISALKNLKTIEGAARLCGKKPEETRG